MRVSITFRHVDPSDAIKQHAEDKVAKLQKFLRQPMTARVTLSIDKLLHAAEVQVSSAVSSAKNFAVSAGLMAPFNRRNGAAGKHCAPAVPRRPSNPA